jgi:RecB family exonuclease
VDAAHVSYFSYSQLALYKRCPKQFWFERILKRPMDLDNRRAFIGHVLGGVVARFYSDMIWKEGKWARPCMASLVNELSASLHLTQHYPWQPGEREDAERACHAALPLILQVVRDEKLVARRVDTEVEVKVPLDTGDVLVGSADLLLEAAPGGHLTLLDAKAGGSLGKYVKADQLRLYQLGIGMHKDFRRLPDRVGFWWLRHGKIIWKRTPKTALKKWVDGVKATIAQLRRDDFGATPGDHCRWCPHRQDCPEGMEKLAVVKTLLASDDVTGVISL